MDTYTKTMTFQTNFKDVLKQIQNMKDSVKDFANELTTSISSSKVVSGIKDFAKKEFYVYHADPMYPSHKEKRNVEILSFSSN